jgi:hypothetical protein
MKRMKGLNFTVPGNFDKILDGTKDLTIRGSFIPKYLRGEHIMLKDKVKEVDEAGNVVKDKKGKDKTVIKRTAEARVVFVKPIQIKNITDAIAKREGFENADESKKWLMNQYSLKSEDHWMFATAWKLLAPPKPQPTIESLIKPDSNGVLP